MVHLLFTRTFNLPPEDAYSKVNAILAQQRAKVVSEEAPKRICVKHGSIWGATPKSAKKTMELTFTSSPLGTEVTCQSRLSADWVNLTVAGCIFAAALAGVCFWMASDLSALLTGGKAGFWSWLATFNGTVDNSIANILLNLTKGLAVFLFAVIVVEAMVVMYVNRRIDAFAKQVLPEAEAESTEESKKRAV